MYTCNVGNEGQDEGRPTPRAKKTSHSPEKEATEFGLSTNLTTRARASSDSGQNMISTLNYQLYNTILMHSKDGLQKTIHSQAMAYNSHSKQWLFKENVQTMELEASNCDPS